MRGISTKKISQGFWGDPVALGEEAPKPGCGRKQKMDLTLWVMGRGGRQWVHAAHHHLILGEHGGDLAFLNDLL